MSGERQFLSRREDAHPIARLGVRRRQHEGRLRQIGPARHGLHVLRAETFGIEDNGDRIACKRTQAKHIHLGESAHHWTPAERRREGARSWHGGQCGTDENN